MITSNHRLGGVVTVEPGLSSPHAEPIGREAAAGGCGLDEVSVRIVSSIYKQGAKLAMLVLYLEGPMTIYRIMELTHQHRRVVQRQLDALVSRGIIRTEDAPAKGRQRPTKVYALQPDRLPEPRPYRDIEKLVWKVNERRALHRVAASDYQQPKVPK